MTEVTQEYYESVIKNRFSYIGGSGFFYLLNVLPTDHEYYGILTTYYMRDDYEEILRILYKYEDLIRFRHL